MRNRSDRGPSSTVRTELACGIDVGFSADAATSAVSAFSVEQRGNGSCIEVFRQTMVLTSTGLDRLVSARQAPLDDDRVRLVTLDAPVTLTHHLVMPSEGRLPDRRFSRGLFANSNRGPQPSSILVPRQGWPLYQRGMKLLALLRASGFSYVSLPKAEFVALPERGVMEVVPKLTLALLCPRPLLASSRPGSGFYKQIDNWLFPHVFAAQAGADSHGVVRGAALQHAQACFGANIVLGPSVFAEAARIDGTHNKDERHEAIGAFAAGFQGALALAGVGCAVGDAEAHFLLPRTWHADWEGAWIASERKKQPVTRLRVDA